MKYQRLKKRLLLETAVVAAVMVVLGGGTFFLDSFSDDYKSENQALSSKISGIANATSALNEKYNKIQRNGPLVKKIAQLQSDDRLNINQQMTKDLFNRLRDQYYLNNLHLTMLPVTETQDTRYKRTTSVIVTSDDTLDFEGLSDEYAYSLLNAIQEDMPGSIEFTRILLTRDGEITNDALKKISETGTASLVKAEIKFTWFGIKPVESNDSTNAAKTK